MNRNYLTGYGIRRRIQLFLKNELVVIVFFINVVIRIMEVSNYS